MQLQKASRKKVKIKLQVGGSSGSGKTAGSLLLAHGMVKDWSKIALIDTENGSAALYAESPELKIGEFMHLELSNFSPETVTKAIDLCITSGMEAIILDSGTHVWEWCVAYNSKLSGNSFTNWAITLDKYNKFKDKMLQSPVHFIMTVRKKEEYAMEQDDKGKTKVVKKGLKEISKGEMSYEFTTVFDVDIAHQTTVSKDRTNIFMDGNPFMITSETGEKILEWCESGKTIDIESMLRDVLDEVRSAQTEAALGVIYRKYPILSDNEDFKLALTNKKELLKTV